MIQAEKTQKMYLSRSLWAYIFVPELQTTVPLRNIISTTIIILWTFSTAFGQQVWPGDVNNNGIVNNIDLLYWGVANGFDNGNGAEGDERPNATTNWQGQDLPTELWGESFPNGLNYAYADCNGDGKVDDADKDVIESNYGFVHGEVTPDEYFNGSPNEDPILLMSSEMTTVPPKADLIVDLDLGVEDNSIEEFYGIAFSVVYDTNFVSRGQPIKFDVPTDSWISGQMGTERPHVFFRNDRENGIVDFAVVRKNGANKTGFGEIGTLNIVMEDIVLGYSTLGMDNIITTNAELQVYPVAPSALVFQIDDGTTPTRDILSPRGLKVYPNPVSGNQISIELENTQESIRAIELFDTNGRKLMERRTGLGSHQTRIDVDNYPAGVYTVKIYSDRGFYVRSFFRKR